MDYINITCLQWDRLNSCLQYLCSGRPWLQSDHRVIEFISDCIQSQPVYLESKDMTDAAYKSR